MFSFRLNNWPIFTVVEADFISKIRMAVVYGNLGNKALVVTNDEMVYALGSHGNRHSETDDICSTLGPMKVEELCGKGIKTFAFGTHHVLALTKQGQVYSWGCNDHGQLGNGCYTSCFVPTLIKFDINDKHIEDIACGSTHSVALTKEGMVYSWGNINGSENVPREVQMGSFKKRVTSIACGKQFNVVITDNGEVYSWGNNNDGQLGIGSKQSTSNPQKVQALANIEKVVCGSSHTIALSSTGVLYVWGANTYGQLGINSKNIYYNGREDINVSTSPKQLEIREMGSVLDIAASYSTDTSIAITENGGNVFIWGKCRGQNIRKPVCSLFKSVNDAFSYYTQSYTTYEPLIFHGDEVEPNLIECFRKAFNDSTTSDLVIKVHGKPIHVHKAILKIRCPYLKTKFEECWDKNNESVIEIQEFSNAVYVAFLQYLYTNEISLPVKDIAELYNLANTYSEDKLKDLCMFTLKKEITVKNTIVLYNKAIKYEAKEMEKYCLNFASNCMIALIQSQDITELDDRIFKSFIVTAAEAGAFNK